MNYEVFDLIQDFRYEITFSKDLYHNNNPMHPRHLGETHKRKENGQIVNINGMAVGQVHFITDEGAFLLLPWCCIISLIPLGPLKK